MCNIHDADDNIKESCTFAESFRGLAQAARKARIICRSDKKGAKVARTKLQRCCKNCCCSSHCHLADHEAIGVLVSPQQVEFPGIEDRSYIYETTELEEKRCHVTLEDDPLMSLICAVDTDLAGDDGALVDTNVPDLVPGY